MAAEPPSKTKEENQKLVKDFIQQLADFLGANATSTPGFLQKKITVTFNGENLGDTIMAAVGALSAMKHEKRGDVTLGDVGTGISTKDVYDLLESLGKTRKMTATPATLEKFRNKLINAQRYVNSTAEYMAAEEAREKASFGTKEECEKLDRERRDTHGRIVADGHGGVEGIARGNYRDKRCDEVLKQTGARRRKTSKLGNKFNRCVKSVRSTVRARPKSSKESAAIAICTKSVLQTRGRTMKRYRKGRLITQKKFRGGCWGTCS